MSDVDIVQRTHTGEHQYYIQHSYDLSLVEDAPGEGPYPSRSDAENAAMRVILAVTGADD